MQIFRGFKSLSYYHLHNVKKKDKKRFKIKPPIYFHYNNNRYREHTPQLAKYCRQQYTRTLILHSKESRSENIYFMMYPNIWGYFSDIQLIVTTFSMQQSTRKIHIGFMKNKLCGQYFPDHNAVITAMKKFVVVQIVNHK